MARPKKTGLDYFPLDTDIDQDDKVIIIIAKYGMEGFGVLIKLLMEIYKNGYVYSWTEKEQIIFSSRVSVDINTVKELVNDCIKWGLFNKEMYEEKSVLTSKGIQERYLLATSRRVDVGINEDLKLVSVDINPSSSEKTGSESTQKKRKEIKVNKTKEKEEKIISEIKDLRSRFSHDAIKLIDQYWNVVKKTRKSNSISYSVILKTMKKWSDFEEVVIKYSLKKHIESYDDGERDENYTLGIMRNTKPEEAADLLNRNMNVNIGSHKKQNKYEPNPQWKKNEKYEKREVEGYESFDELLQRGK